MKQNINNAQKHRFQMDIPQTFVQFQTSEQTLFDFLILGKSRFPAKKFYNINYRGDSLQGKDQYWSISFYCFLSQESVPSTP